MSGDEIMTVADYRCMRWIEVGVALFVCVVVPGFIHWLRNAR